MCLYIIPCDEVIKTAKVDMAVYKIIQLRNKSLYEEFQYVPNRMYRLRRSLEIIPKYDYDIVMKGFHAYTDIEVARAIALDMFRGKVVKFTIPRGAKYILGDGNEIVATSIRSGDLKCVF